MAHSHNEFDGVAPNTQKPRNPHHPATVGFPWNKWDEVHGVTGSFDTVIISGLSVQPYDDSMVLAGLAGVFIAGSGDPPPAPTSYVVMHNLGTEFVDVQFYDTNKQVLQPDSIIVIDKNSIQINFVEPQEGNALIQRGKIITL